MSVITATAWVPRGYAAQFPAKYDIDEQELRRVSQLARLNLDDAKHDLAAAEGPKTNEGETTDENAVKANAVRLPQSNGDIDDDLREYDLDHYDSDEVDEVGDPATMFGNVRSLAYHESNDDDPYITFQGGEDDEDERKELQVLPSDNMLVAAKVEDEVAHVEIYVYEDSADNLYVHHDIMLPAIPLCVEWLDISIGTTSVGQSMDQARGNSLAVGTFEPDIEIWDLDSVDRMYPNAVLGFGGESAKDPDDGSKKKKKRKKSKKVNDDYHVDAVLALAANRGHRTLLASGSADNTIKLWDLNTNKCAKSYSYHTDKVCSLAWHPKETTVLLSGSYDRTVVAADMRAPDTKFPRWGVESDVEMVRWNCHDPNYFFVTTENGVIHYHDVRKAPSTLEASLPIWRLQAHNSAVSSFDVNPTIPGFFATGSTTKEVKLWSFEAGGPSMVVSRNLDVGKVFSTTFAPDAEVSFRLAVAGSKGTVQVWDTSTNSAVRHAFAERVAPVHGEVKERFVGVNAEDSDDSSSDDDEEGGISATVRGEEIETGDDEAMDEH